MYVWERDRKREKERKLVHLTRSWFPPYRCLQTTKPGQSSMISDGIGIHFVILVPTSVIITTSFFLNVKTYTLWAYTLKTTKQAQPSIDSEYRNTFPHNQANIHHIQNIYFSYCCEQLLKDRRLFVAKMFNKIVTILVIASSAVMLPVLPGCKAGGCGCPPLWTAFQNNCYR